MKKIAISLAILSLVLISYSVGEFVKSNFDGLGLLFLGPIFFLGIMILSFSIVMYKSKTNDKGIEYAKNDINKIQTNPYASGLVLYIFAGIIFPAMASIVSGGLMFIIYGFESPQKHLTMERVVSFIFLFLGIWLGAKIYEKVFLKNKEIGSPFSFTIFSTSLFVIFSSFAGGTLISVYRDFFVQALATITLVVVYGLFANKIAEKFGSKNEDNVKF